MTVLSIPEALEDPGGSGCCGKPETFVLQELWAEDSQALTRVYQTLTLAALLQRQKDKEASPLPNHSI